MLYRVPDEINKSQIMGFYLKSINTLVERIDDYVKATTTSSVKYESLQIGIIKLKILHNIQRMIMFDEFKSEVENALFELFDLLQIKETFLKEKLNVSVEGFLRNTILKVPNVGKMQNLILKISNELELGFDRKELIKLLQSQVVQYEPKEMKEKSFNNEKKIMKIGDVKLNCSEDLKTSFSLTIKSRKFSKINVKQENLEENKLFEDNLFEFDYNYNVFQYIPRRTNDEHKKASIYQKKSDKKMILDNNRYFNNETTPSNPDQFKAPNRILKYGINSRLALNMRFIPKIKVKKNIEKHKLDTNILKKHYKDFGLMGSERSSMSNREFCVRDRSNIASEICINKSMISSQKTDVLAFCTPMDVNFFKTKRTLHF